MNIKFSLSLIAILGVFGIAVFIFLQNEEATVTASLQTYSPNRAEVHDATLDLLAAAPGVVQIGSAFLTIAPGQNGDLWSVRGTFNKENRNIPLFASVRYHCANGKENERCWSLDKLIIDGIPSLIRTHKTDARKRPNVKGSAGSLAPQSADGNLLRKTSKTQPLSGVNATITPKSQEKSKFEMAGSENKAKANSVQQTPSTTTVASPIWRTRSNNVNARSGPGLDYKIIFKMSTTTTLILIEQQEGWGLFEYPAANREQGQVWIHMNMVQKNSS